MIYVVSFLALIMIVAFAICGVNFKRDVTELKQSVSDLKQTVENVSKPSPIKPKDGYTPVKGLDYFDGQSPECLFTISKCEGKAGKDSMSTHTETSVIKESPGRDGKDGKDGARGPAGPPIEVYTDPESCLFMTKTPNDTSWTVQAQLPKPCEVL